MGGFFFFFWKIKKKEKYFIIPFFSYAIKKILRRGEKREKKA
jgi:hypothetical protein